MTARTEAIHAADVDGEDGVKKEGPPYQRRQGRRAGTGAGEDSSAMTPAGRAELPERWFSQRETCQFFGLSPDYLMVLEGEGLLSPIRDGGRLVRYWPADVLAAIQKRGHRRPRRSRQVPDLQVAAARNL